VPGFLDSAEKKMFTSTNKGTKKVKVYTIPAGATGFSQPLDDTDLDRGKTF